MAVTGRVDNILHCAIHCGLVESLSAQHAVQIHAKPLVVVTFDGVLYGYEQHDPWLCCGGINDCTKHLRQQTKTCQWRRQRLSNVRGAQRLLDSALCMSWVMRAPFAACRMTFLPSLHAVFRGLEGDVKAQWTLGHASCVSK